jgi:hypothetical protein
MDKSIFEWYIESIFIPELLRKRKDSGRDNAKSLLLDSHSSRNNKNLMEKLKAANVTVLTFRSHSSHICQPLDLCINSNFKKKVAKLYSKKAETVKEHREEVVSIIQDCVHSCLSPKGIQSAFERAGVIPFNVSKVLDPLPFGDLQTLSFIKNKKINLKQKNLECSILTSDLFLENWN